MVKKDTWGSIGTAAIIMFVVGISILLSNISLQGTFKDPLELAILGFILIFVGISGFIISWRKGS